MSMSETEDCAMIAKARNSVWRQHVRWYDTEGDVDTPRCVVVRVEQQVAGERVSEGVAYLREGGSIRLADGWRVTGVTALEEASRQTSGATPAS